MQSSKSSRERGNEVEFEYIEYIEIAGIEKDG